MEKNKKTSTYLIQDKPDWVKYFASKNPFFLLLYVGPLISVLSFLLYKQELGLNPFALIAGLIYWSLIEYAVHRFLYHNKIQNKWFRYIVGSFHQYHHNHLNDHRVLNAGLLMIYTITPVVMAPFALILTESSLLSMTLGLVLYYYAYEWVHYLIHYKEYKTGYMAYIQKYHLHHHRYAPLKNFGNTHHLWDKVFRTYDPKYKSYHMDEKMRASMITSHTKKKLVFPRKIDELNQYQYLFLGGILGEILELPFVGQYFRPNRDILIANGVCPKSICIKTPNSLKSAQDNIPKLKKLVQNLYRENGGKKIIVFAHSKACLEAFFLLEALADERESMIQSVICSGATFNGSPLFNRRHNHWFDTFSYYFIKWGSKVIPGTSCLAPGHYSAKIKQLAEHNKTLRAFIKERFLIIKGHKQAPQSVAPILKLSHHILALAGHKNDGLVAYQDQYLPYFDYTELDLIMDHSDLYTANLTMMSNERESFRVSQMNSLLDWAINTNSPVSNTQTYLGQESSSKENIDHLEVIFS
jgi:sterol desaturase/sphingolipid hydroxylase (fatty acid hydroxylase superfamily)